MAQFHCSSCGYREVVPPDYVNRRARCPHCQHVDRIEGDSATFGANRAGFVSTLWNWSGVMLCGLVGALVIAGVWDSYPPLPTDSSSPVAADVAPRNSVAPVRVEPSEATPLVTVQDDSGPADATTVIPVSDVKSLPVDNDPTPPQKVLASLPETQPASRKVERTVKPWHAASNVPLSATDDLSTARVPAVKVGKKSVVNGSQNTVNAVNAPTAAEIAAGKMHFEHQWQPNDPLAGTGDGLGPVYNARSCVECHFQGGSGGSGTNSHNVQSFEVLPDHQDAKVYDGVIHAAAVSPDLQESKKDLTERLGSPKVPFRRTKLGKKDSILEVDAVRTVFMNTPALWGNGLIDQITDNDLNQLEITHPSVGRFRRGPDGRIGKFGWKAQTVSLRQFVGSACAAELGLSNSIRSQQVPRQYHDNPQAAHDLTDEQVKSLTSFVASLPTPQQVLPTDPAGLKNVDAGERLFNAIGCATCHARDVGPAHGVYSDFRLHHIDAAATRVETYYVIDATPIYQPGGHYPQLGEWKTPPLWGLADTAPYWHDGSAHTITQAILKHEQDGATSRDQFKILTPDEQSQVLAFLNSLKAPVVDL
ncbi:MAG: c-type cytochrome [Planctomycetes bacterium]|nr:c-type cytochrome [Planctomycetota bacterium]